MRSDVLRWCIHRRLVDLRCIHVSHEGGGSQNRPKAGWTFFQNTRQDMKSRGSGNLLCHHAAALRSCEAVGEEWGLFTFC